MRLPFYPLPAVRTRHRSRAGSFAFAGQTTGVLGIALACCVIAGCNQKPQVQDAANSAEPVASPVMSVATKADMCTDVWQPALEIIVLDANTAAPVSCGATIEVRDQDYYEEVKSLDQYDCNQRFPLQAAYEREGTYRVTVEQRGYQPWSSPPVEVRRGSCHVLTKQLEVRLKPL
ncbi:carboxypeptidase-like regulatory domain-containing protein [Pokkaliibacter plantistimulans]|uniref:carboxypeptidase-like regulatory domain-containing protein n=1 Tax=Pokkaliibacter plantistimulans TaxID=1635171 RepID=UPI0011B053B4|nr:carboxypeptidase-like regulatory domain-containing protein [Pokkaliibacter plantistimulans]